MTSTDPGGQRAAPPPGVTYEEWIGTRPWAERMRLELQAHVERLDYEPNIVARYLDKFSEHKAWELLTKEDGTSYRTFREFCEEPQPWGLGVEYGAMKRRLSHNTKRLDLLDRQEQKPPGGNNNPHGRRGKPAAETNGDIITVDSRDTAGGRGTSVQYSLRRLRAAAPEVHAEVVEGKLSANAGMIKAGLRKKKTPLDHLKREWNKATDDERAEFMAFACLVHADD